LDDVAGNLCHALPSSVGSKSVGAMKVWSGYARQLHVPVDGWHTPTRRALHRVLNCLLTV
jgi:hypothetical protein